VAFGALVAAIAAALGVGFVQRHSRVGYDTAIAIFFVSAFSLGILVMSRSSSYTPDLLSFVFGDILGVSQADLLGEFVLAAVVVLFVLAFYRELVMVAYDPAMAAAAGVRVAFFEYALLALIAAAVVVALQAIGIVLVSAILIIPPATAGLLVHRLPQIIGLAIVFATLASVAGLHLSFHASVATGPAVVLVSAALFALMLAATALRRPRLPAAAFEAIEVPAEVRQTPS
jgi:manganese/iron transport system permease protein